MVYIYFLSSVNDITTLADFEDCINLQELYIRNNKIENLYEICYLRKCDKLRILWLADNPCSTGDNYRQTVLRNLPNLQKLDNIGKYFEENSMICFTLNFYLFFEMLRT